jgi:hypothetical protein
MGRKKGSKNKPKIIMPEVNTGEPLPIKRGRGRPKKIQTTPEVLSGQTQQIPVFIDIKEIKKQMRILRKLKKDTRKKTDERREINEKIRDLKTRLMPIYKEENPEKAKIIEQILKIRSISKIYILQDLRKFTIEQLQKHYEYLKQGKSKIQ